MSKYLNILSNIGYPIVGYMGDTWTFGTGVLLMIGSGWMHYEQEFKGNRSTASILADWFGMYAFTLACIAYSTTPVVMLALIPIAFLYHDMRDNNLIGLMVILLILITKSWIAIPVFSVAVVVRNTFEDTKWQDYSHGLVWHPLSAYGYYITLINITITWDIFKNLFT